MKLKRPNEESLMGGGRMSITPIDILGTLLSLSLYDGCFFDSRHWVYEPLNGALPFAVTTRISANNQQYLLLYEETE